MFSVSCIVPYFYKEIYYKYRNFFEFLLFPLICTSKYQLTPNKQTSFIKNKYFSMLFSYQYFMIMRLPIHIFLWILLEKDIKFGTKLEFCTTTTITHALLFKVSNLVCKLFQMCIVQIYNQIQLLTSGVKLVFLSKQSAF